MAYSGYWLTRVAARCVIEAIQYHLCSTHRGRRNKIRRNGSRPRQNWIRWTGTNPKYTKEDKILKKKTTDCKFVFMEFSRSSGTVMWVGTLFCTWHSTLKLASHWIFFTHLSPQSSAISHMQRYTQPILSSTVTAAGERSCSCATLLQHHLLVYPVHLLDVPHIHLVSTHFLKPVLDIPWPDIANDSMLSDILWNLAPSICTFSPPTSTTTQHVHSLYAFLRILYLSFYPPSWNEHASYRMREQSTNHIS